MSLSSFISQNLATVLIFLLVTEAVSLILVVYCFFRLAAVKRKSEVFFEGKNGKNLEELILRSVSDIKSLDSEIQELYGISNAINNLSLSSIHRVGILRFNPFGDIGGDQSFSVAFLDGKNSGLVISSLHTREGTRVYAKPIDKGEAEKYPLTEEEKKVIKIAMQNKPSKV
jgi:hypothetical protein